MYFTYDREGRQVAKKMRRTENPPQNFHRFFDQKLLNIKQKLLKKQQRHNNCFWDRLWGHLFSHRDEFGRFFGPGQVPKMS